jgi:3-ketosteroid 9alpha-monooxygenase subunit B
MQNAVPTPVAAARAYHPLGIADVVEETADARSLVLDVPSPLRPAFAYKAGQFLTLAIPWQDQRLSRCYSLSSSPDCDGTHQVTVKRVSGGRASNWLIDHARAGATLEVLPPAGRFVLRENEDRDLLLFAAGSGITPIFSLLKTALHARQCRAKLLFANRDAGSIIFARELERLEREFRGRFELSHSLDERDGFLTEARVLDHVRGRESADHYVCGPAPFMDLVGAALEKNAVPRERIFIERFVSGSDLPSDVAPAPARAGTFHARWQGRVHLVPYEAGETLLQAALRAGVDPPFSCEDGYCSSCQARLLRGQVQMRSHDCLSDDEVAGGAVLACQAFATTSELEIDWD